MARPKEFDRDQALAAAIAVFGEHGYAGTSTQMLTGAMNIGRQSMYDTFGDKWRLYCAALRQYSIGEMQEHRRALESGARAIQGLERFIARVVAQARTPCLGTNSIGEFGNQNEELARIHGDDGPKLAAAVAAGIGRARDEGDVAAEVDPQQAAAFLCASIAAIRMAARAGAGDAELHSLGRYALRALR